MRDFSLAHLLGRFRIAGMDSRSRISRIHDANR